MKSAGECVQASRIVRYLSLEDLEERMAFIENALSKEKKSGLELLVVALSDDKLPLLYREEALEILTKALDENPEYDPQISVSQNRKALRRICDLIKKEKE
ncbi:MAG: hypothetical protein JXA30_16330 [Deltaproteobacteria bacterium]|nr:hypothetical protein [Deltaproteobacteria bacterium]